MTSKFQQLLNDITNIGSVTGFKYFTLQLNGNEELLCSVLNNPLTTNRGHGFEFYNVNDTTSSNITVNDNKKSLKKSKPPLLSQASQTCLLKESGNIGTGLPPASPTESCTSDDGYTLFLIGAYPNYGRPYVWVRNHHDRFLTDPDFKNEINKDSPVRLRSSLEWYKRDIRIWDIIAELITISCRPVPRNPFAIDLDYYDNFPLVESTLSTGAAIRTLQDIVSYDHQYNDKVWDTLQQLTKRHFENLEAVVGNWYTNVPHPSTRKISSKPFIPT